MTLSRTAIRRAEFRAQGLCSGCGRQREDEHLRKCRACRAISADYMDRKRIARTTGNTIILKQRGPTKRIAPPPVYTTERARVLLEVQEAWERALKHNTSFSTWIARQLKGES